jgi:mitogen-activated protein kinase 6
MRPCPATQIIGSPSEEELGFITSDKAKRYIRSLPKSERVNFAELWPQANKHVGLGPAWLGT